MAKLRQRPDKASNYTRRMIMAEDEAPSTPADSGLPREPRQKRSRIRFAKLLDATDALLATRELSDIGLYDVAEAAGMPPASVYHFFPTKEAIFFALAGRYLEALSDLTARASAQREDIRQWPQLFVSAIRRSIAYYNQHPVMMKLLLSGTVTAEIRKREIEYNRRIALGGYDWMNQYFHMPHLPGVEDKFATVWAIFDGISIMSYGQHGHVTETFTREIEAAVIAYCSTFLPPVIAVRAVGEINQAADAAPARTSRKRKAVADPA